MTDRNDGRPRHSASHIHCAVPFFCARSGTEGEAARRCGDGRRSSVGNVLWGRWAFIAQPAGVRRGCVGERKCSGRACRCAGASKVFGGEWVVRSAGLTHIRRSSTRARVLLYIRPPCPRREIAAMGPKDAPASTHRPRRLPYPPRLRLHFRARVHTFPVRVHTSPAQPSAPPPRSNRPPAAAVIHNGLSTEKLSTSLLAALCKTFSPSRLRTRIYNISFARRPLPGVSAPLWERGRAVVARVPRRRAQGGGGRGQRRTPPRAVPRTCPPTAVPLPPTAESLCAKAEVHKVIPALPVRSPRVSPPKTEPPPADGRSAVRPSRVSLSTAVHFAR